MRAMILAAGRGERMRPLTDHCPKPLLRVGGRELIVWHIEALVRAGIRDLVINHAWLGEQIETRLGDGARFGARIRYSHEPRALETAGGIVQALPMLGDAPFLVVNGDIFSDFDYGRATTIATQMRAAALQAWCVLVANPLHNPQGDFGLRNGLLREICGHGLTFSGIGIYCPGLFAGVHAGQSAPLAPLLRSAARETRAGAERHDGRWTDVGTPERLTELNAQWPDDAKQHS